MAATVNAEATDNLDNLRKDADLYIISVKDDAIGEIVSKAGHSNALWVHTSGSVPMEILSGIGDRYGVLYPMQTFSKDVDVDMEKVARYLSKETAERH